jgi:hypothetical protein
MPVGIESALASQPVQLRLCSLPIALVIKINKHHRWLPSICAIADIRLTSNGSAPTWGVCRPSAVFIRNVYAKYFHVQVMIDNVHSSIRTGTRWAVDVAVGECSIRYVVGGLKVVGKLVKNIRNFRNIRIVVWEVLALCPCIIIPSRVERVKVEGL